MRTISGIMTAMATTLTVLRASGLVFGFSVILVLVPTEGMVVRGLSVGLDVKAFASFSVLVLGGAFSVDVGDGDFLVWLVVGDSEGTDVEAISAGFGGVSVVWSGDPVEYISVD